MLFVSVRLCCVKIYDTVSQTAVRIEQMCNLPPVLNLQLQSYSVSQYSMFLCHHMTSKDKKLW